MDLSTQPFWRVETYLEYPGTEMWQMHHDPLRRVDLFEREKLALSYGVHAAFGIRHVGAHMPLLWPKPPLTPGGKAARYVLSNLEMTSYHGSPLRLLGRYDSVRVHEVLDWRPRLERLRSQAGSDSISQSCPPTYSGHAGLCVYEPRDGELRVRGAFLFGDTLVFREHWHKGWRVQIDGGKWKNPGPYAHGFMAVELVNGAKEVRWRF